jgi:iron(III) transport system substrate-binding protein
MHRRTVLVSAVALLAVAASSAFGAEWEDRLQKLYPAAKEEGQLIFNTERIEEVGGKEGLALFEKRFPGITVEFSGIAGSELPSRISAEAKAGKVSIDIFRADPDRAIVLHDAGLLLELDPAELTDQEVKTFLDNTFIKLSDHISNFAYNTDLVKPEEAPKTYEDLLDPKWKGKLALDARGGQIAHLLSNKIWDETKFWDFVKALKAQEPLWTTRNTEAMAKITSGEGYIGTGSYAAVEELKDKGAPIEFLFLSPSLAQVRGASIVKGAPHPNAAKLFLGWLLSPEGLEARDKNAVGTVTPGTTLYKLVEERHAELTYEETLDQILARDAVGKKITAEWGALK